METHREGSNIITEISNEVNMITDRHTRIERVRET